MMIAQMVKPLVLSSSLLVDMHLVDIIPYKPTPCHFFAPFVFERFPSDKQALNWQKRKHEHDKRSEKESMGWGRGR